MGKGVRTSLRVYLPHRKSTISQNAGDQYVYSRLSAHYNGYDDLYTPGDLDRRVRNSVVIDTQTGDIIIKLVSIVGKQNRVTVHLGADFDLAAYHPSAPFTLLSCAEKPNNKRQWDTNETTPVNIDHTFTLTLPSYSVGVLRIQKKGKK